MYGVCECVCVCVCVCVISAGTSVLCDGICQRRRPDVPHSDSGASSKSLMQRM